MARGRSQKREQYWRKVIGNQKASGLSISAFCHKHDVAQASFFSWRRKLLDPSPVEPTAKFVPIELAHAASSNSVFEVALPNGVRVVVPPRFDSDALRLLLGVLEDKPC